MSWDLKAILQVIDQEIWDDDEFTAKVDVLIRKIGEGPSKGGFKCEKCKKPCKFKQGLSRQQNSKHRKVQPEQEEGGTSTAAENRLNPACLKIM